jgi:hypothetical protein
MATTQVLPKELRFNAPPTMPMARSYLYKQYTEQDSYNPASGGTIQIDLPRLQRSYLTKDSYLRFRLGFTTTDATNAFQPGIGVSTDAGATGTKLNNYLCFDNPGALGLIDQIEVYDYLGSTLLESTSGHGQLMSLLLDLNSDAVNTGFHYNNSMGISGGFTRKDNFEGNGSATNTISTGTKSRLFSSNSGEAILSSYADGYSGTGYDIIPGGSNTIPKAKIYEYAIPLFSFLGLNSDKYAPLHNGYTIIIKLNPFAQAFGIAGDLNAGFQYAGNAGTGTDKRATVYPTSYELTNVAFVAQILELGPTAESMLRSSTGGSPMIIPYKSYRNYFASIPAKAATLRLDMNLNVASLTNVLWIMRNAGNLYNIGKKSLSARVRNYLQSWNFQYGSSTLPLTEGIQCGPKPGTNATLANSGSDEAYNELLKSRHALNVDIHSSQINERNFGIDANKIGTTETDALSVHNPFHVGKFAAGLDLELIPGRSKNLICGLNTNGMTTTINGTFDLSNIDNVANVRMDAWAEYDAFINVVPGVATTVSF